MPNTIMKLCPPFKELQKWSVQIHNTTFDKIDSILKSRDRYPDAKPFAKAVVVTPTALVIGFDSMDKIALTDAADKISAILGISWTEATSEGRPFTTEEILG